MTTSKRTPAPRRRDGSGHLYPEYEADLLALSRVGKESDPPPFVDATSTEDPVATLLGVEFVETVTNAQDEGQEVLDRHTPEEDGGPFIETSAQTEFASDVDESNIEGALREPFPTV